MWGSFAEIWGSFAKIWGSFAKVWGSFAHEQDDRHPAAFFPTASSHCRRDLRYIRVGMGHVSRVNGYLSRISKNCDAKI